MFKMKPVLMGPLMPAIPLVLGAASVFQGVKGYQDAKQAAKDQKKLARANTQNIQAETDERLRRANVSEAKRSGTSRARAAASGLKGGGSMAQWEQAQQLEFDKQMEWLQNASQSRQQQALMGGDTAADRTRASGSQALWSGLGGGVKEIAKSEWWT